MAIKLKCKIKAKHNFKNFNQIQKKLPQAIADGIEEVLKNIRGYAIKLERGNNSDGILVEMINVSTKEVKGRVFASPDKFATKNGSYLWFEYFGTGRLC